MNDLRAHCHLKTFLGALILLQETNETFSVHLSKPTGGGRLGTQSRTIVTIIDDDEPGYYQDAKMTKLARQAHDMGAEWVLPFDADEVWYAEGGTIAQALDTVTADVVMAAGWDHIIRDDGDAPFSPWRRQQPQTLCKVAFRARPDAELNMGNHDVRPAEHRNYRHRCRVIVISLS